MIARLVRPWTIAGRSIWGPLRVGLFPDEETSQDWAIREEDEQIRKAFPEIDVDHLGASKLKGPRRRSAEGGDAADLTEAQLVRLNELLP